MSKNPPFQTVMVTGGAGFIGSHLVDHLIENGIRARVFDNLSNGKKSNLEANWSRNDFEFVQGDIRDRAAVRNALKGVQGVVHLAAVNNVFESMKNPEMTIEINAGGTASILKACEEEGVERVILASSASVYGAPKRLPVQEKDDLRPLSPYAASKIALESLASVSRETYGIQTLCLRFFNVYGPRQDPSSPYCGVITRFQSFLSSGQSCLLNDGGRQKRDFVHVKDVARGILKGLTEIQSAPLALNIGTGKAISILELAQTMKNLMNSSSVLQAMPAQAGDILDSVANIELAENSIGFKPEIDLQTGLKTLLF